MSLFREEVLAARRHRLFGDVTLTQPVQSWILALLLAAMTGTALIAAAFGTYARIETVPGYLAATVPVAKIQALRAGVVTQLYVKNDTVVKAGDLLASVRLDFATQRSATPGADTAASIENQISIAQMQLTMETQRAALQRSKQSGALAALEVSRASIADQLKLQQSIVASARQAFEQLAELVEKGYASKIEYERRRQAYLALEQQHQQLRQQFGQAQSQIAQARSDMAQMPLEARSRQGDLTSSIQALRQRLTLGASDQTYVITAPISGRITALQTGVGRLASPNFPLMTIVPDGATFEARLYAPSRAAGFMAPGQSVRLRYDAFPYQRFGSFAGSIVEVSHTVLSPGEIDGPVKLEEPVYPLTVKLERQQVSAFGQSIALQPGMTLSANIVLDRRSFLDWLLEPLRAVRARA
jgi:membrane fusion protein